MLAWQQKIQVGMALLHDTKILLTNVEATYFKHVQCTTSHGLLVHTIVGHKTEYGENYLLIFVQIFVQKLLYVMMEEFKWRKKAYFTKDVQ